MYRSLLSWLLCHYLSKLPWATGHGRYLDLDDLFIPWVRTRRVSLYGRYSGQLDALLSIRNVQRMSAEVGGLITSKGARYRPPSSNGSRWIEAVQLLNNGAVQIARRFTAT